MSKTLKQISIETYGDLTTTLFVSFDEVDKEYKFNIEEKEENKLNFEDLKVEYNKQNDAPIKEDLTILNIGNVEGSLLTNIDDTTLEEAKTKAKKASIEKIGDLKTKTFEVFVKKNILMFRWQKPKKQIIGKKKYWIAPSNVFNRELNFQGDPVEEDYTIYNLPSTLNFEGVEQAKAKIQKISIDTYGDLKNDPIKVDYEYNDYTFWVENKIKIIGSQKLEKEFFKQTGENEKVLLLTKKKGKFSLDKEKPDTEKPDKEKGIKIYFEINQKYNINQKCFLDAYWKHKFIFSSVLTERRKKALTEIPKTPPIDSSNLGTIGIISIVLGVFVLLITIGLILKKYFKNKKRD